MNLYKLNGVGPEWGAIWIANPNLGGGGSEKPQGNPTAVMLRSGVVNRRNHKESFVTSMSWRWNIIGNQNDIIAYSLCESYIRPY